MNTYICNTCGRPQYSSSREKSDEPCVYCGAMDVEWVCDYAADFKKETNNE